MRVFVFREGEVVVEICRGEIPDGFIKRWFCWVTELELPDRESNATDEDFMEWLDSYRAANDESAKELLEKIQCN